MLLNKFIDVNEVFYRMKNVLVGLEVMGKDRDEKNSKHLQKIKGPVHTDYI